MAGRFQLGSQARLAKRALDARDKDKEGWWAGATWIFSALTTNDGATQGNHIYNCTPGEDSEFAVMYGSIHNLDAVNRTAGVFLLDDEAHEIAILGSVGAVTAGFSRQIPQSGQVNDGRGVESLPRIIVSGECELRAQYLSIAVSKATRFLLAARVRGEKPAVTFNMPSGSTTVTEKDRFF